MRLWFKIPSVDYNVANVGGVSSRWTTATTITTTTVPHFSKPTLWSHRAVAGGDAEAHDNFLFCVTRSLFNDDNLFMLRSSIIKFNLITSIRNQSLAPPPLTRILSHSTSSQFKMESAKPKPAVTQPPWQSPKSSTAEPKLMVYNSLTKTKVQSVLQRI